MNEVTLPLKLESVANLREHWSKKAKRARSQRSLAMVLVGNRLTRTWQAMPDLEITLIRIAPRPLDDDNLRGAFKAVRDGVADALGVQDNDPRVTWQYAQERGKPKEYACRVEVQVRPSDSPSLPSRSPT